MSSTHHMKRNDTAPPLTAILKSGSTVVDLTSASVRFHMKDSGGKLHIDAAATVVSASDGTVRYDWTVDDTDVSGLFQGEFEVTFVDGSVRTFPANRNLTVQITDDLA